MKSHGTLRPPRDVHILSWVLSLDKLGYIPCHFKNCSFMAMTLDEMVDHFNRSECFKMLPFYCETCKLYTDMESKLLYHKIYSHSLSTTKEAVRDLIDFRRKKKQISVHLIKGWTLYRQHKGYFKCLYRPCLYIPNTYDEMVHHHLEFCVKEFWDGLRFKCDLCAGKFNTDDLLKEHQLAGHKRSTIERTVQFKQSASEVKLRTNWVAKIISEKQAACPVPECRFVANSVAILDNHYRSCTGKKKYGFVECCRCKSWLLNEKKLAEHWSSIHNSLSSAPPPLSSATPIVGSLPGQHLDSRNHKASGGMGPNSMKRSNLSKDFLQNSFSIKLEEVSNSLQLNTTTIPVEIRIDNSDNQSFTVDVSSAISNVAFPTSEESVIKTMREESFKLLSVVNQISSARNDMHKSFIIGEKCMFPVNLSVKKKVDGLSNGSAESKDRGESNKSLSDNLNVPGHESDVYILPIIIDSDNNSFSEQPPHGNAPSGLESTSSKCPKATEKKGVSNSDDLSNQVSQVSCGKKNNVNEIRKEVPTNSTERHELDKFNCSATVDKDCSLSGKRGVSDNEITMDCQEPTATCLSTNIQEPVSQCPSPFLSLPNINDSNLVCQNRSVTDDIFFGFTPVDQHHSYLKSIGLKKCLNENKHIKIELQNRDLNIEQHFNYKTSSSRDLPYPFSTSELSFEYCDSSSNDGSAYEDEQECDLVLNSNELIRYEEKRISSDLKLKTNECVFFDEIVKTGLDDNKNTQRDELCDPLNLSPSNVEFSSTSEHEDSVTSNNHGNGDNDQSELEPESGYDCYMDSFQLSDNPVAHKQQSSFPLNHYCLIFVNPLSQPLDPSTYSLFYEEDNSIPCTVEPTSDVFSQYQGFKKIIDDLKSSTNHDEESDNATFDDTGHWWWLPCNFNTCPRSEPYLDTFDDLKISFSTLPPGFYFEMFLYGIKYLLFKFSSKYFSLSHSVPNQHISVRSNLATSDSQKVLPCVLTAHHSSTQNDSSIEKLEKYMYRDVFSPAKTLESQNPCKNDYLLANKHTNEWKQSTQVQKSRSIDAAGFLTPRPLIMKSLKSRSISPSRNMLTEPVPSTECLNLPLTKNKSSSLNAKDKYVQKKRDAINDSHVLSSSFASVSKKVCATNKIVSSGRSVVYRNKTRKSGGNFIPCDYTFQLISESSSDLVSDSSKKHDVYETNLNKYINHSYKTSNSIPSKNILAASIINRYADFNNTFDVTGVNRDFMVYTATTITETDRMSSSYQRPSASNATPATLQLDSNTQSPLVNEAMTIPTESSERNELCSTERGMSSDLNAALQDTELAIKRGRPKNNSFSSESNVLGIKEENDSASSLSQSIEVTEDSERLVTEECLVAGTFYHTPVTHDGLPKKRGRPKKNTSCESNVLAVKKGNDSAFSFSQSIEVTEASERVVTEECLIAGTSYQLPTTPDGLPKKRGRPKKNKSCESHMMAVKKKNDPESNEFAGNSEWVVSEECLVAGTSYHPSASSDELSKKRGRPKTNKLSCESHLAVKEENDSPCSYSQSIKISDDTECVPPEGCVVAGSSYNTPVTPDRQQKKRGRPKKNRLSFESPDKRLDNISPGFDFEGHSEMTLGHFMGGNIQSHHRSGEYLSSVQTVTPEDGQRTSYLPMSGNGTPAKKPRLVPDWRQELKDTPPGFNTASSVVDEEGNVVLTLRQIRLRALTGRIDPTTKLINPKKEVKCAVCGETMTALVYQKQHLLKHNFLAWLEGEKPLPMDDLDLLKNVLTRGKKAHPKCVFTCDVCQEKKRSAVGFLSHRQFCGRSDEERHGLMVTCMYCGKVMMPYSLEAHMYQYHRIGQQLPESTQDSDPLRTSASKCRGKIADITGGSKRRREYNDEKNEEYYDNEEMKHCNQDVPRYKRSSVSLSKKLKFYWKARESRGDPLKCTLSKCSFQCTTFEDMAAHYEKCPLNSLVTFSCLKCRYSNQNEVNIKEHVRNCSEQPDLEPVLADSSDEETYSYDIPFLRKEEQSSSKLKAAYEWRKAVEERNLSSSPLFTEYQPSPDSWECLSSSELLKYSPKANTSLPLRFKNRDYPTMITFEGNISEDKEGGVGYCGGPVRGLAWAPGDGAQFLAVAAHQSVDSNFQVGSTYHGPALVQLWTIGNNTTPLSMGMDYLRLVYGVCYEEGGCWEIAWCPSGGRTKSRLGLLALATTSGCIPIFALPQPDLLPLTKSTFFKFKPVMKLELPSNDRCQCSAVSWSKLKPHRRLVAGFVNGMVAIWDLSTQSSLLRQVGGTLNPHKVFHAHNSYVTGVCLSPENDDFLASASMEKSLKLWDLRDTTGPQSVTSLGLATGLDWITNFMTVATSHDIAYLTNSSSVSLSSAVGMMLKRGQVTATPGSTAWSVSANDWLNALAASFENGQVTVTYAISTIIHNGKKKRKYNKVIVKSSLKESRPDESTEGEGQSEDSPSSRGIPSSYEGAAYGRFIHIETDLMMDENSCSTKENPTETSNEEELDIYPLTSVNKVTWNPNRDCFNYLAMGYQSGFLIITKLTFDKTSTSLPIKEEIS